MDGIKINVKEYKVTRGGFSLKGIDFNVKKGEIMGILGKTGSGKTILLEGVSGMFSGIVAA
jgi:molybdate transport system ATP-binding protein